MAIIATGEKRSPVDQLSKNATNSPDVNRLQQRPQLPPEPSFPSRAVRTLVYILNDSMISGARYHRVATYSVMRPTSFPPGFVERVLRASPKSQTLRSQFALSRRFAGLRSRWTMSAECIVFRARRVW